MIAPGDLEDDDRDGHPDMACDGGTDCDDRDPFTGPGMPELCDGVDNDCDGTIDEGTDTATATWYADGDGDGIGGAVGVVAGCERPRGSFVTVGGDCNDDDPEVGPERLERCNGIDDDCDGEVDEGAPGVLRIYPDGDGDGFGTGEGRFACAIDAGHVTLPGDCDDEVASTHPGATEFCNVADDDCDDFVDEDAEPVNWFVDGDGDGHGDPLSAPDAQLHADRRPRPQIPMTATTPPRI